MSSNANSPQPPASGPTTSGRRFLVKLMAHAFDDGWRTPDDFLRHFPADELLRNLSRAPELRVALLAAVTGIYEEILRRKTPALAAQDLRLALDEGMTSSSQNAVTTWKPPT